MPRVVTPHQRHSLSKACSAALFGLLIANAAPAATLLESEDTLYNLNLLGFFHIDFGDQLSADDSGPDIERGFQEARLIGHFSSQLGPRLSAFMEVEATATNSDSTVKMERVVVKYDIDNNSQFSVGRFHSTVGYWNQYYHHGRWLQVTKDRPVQTEFGHAFLPAHHWGAMYERSFRRGDRIIELDLSAGAGRDEDIVLPEMGHHGGGSFRHGGHQGNGPRLRSNWAVMSQVNIVPSDRRGFAFGGSFWAADLEGNGDEYDELIITGHINYTDDTSALLGEVAWVQHDADRGGGSADSLAGYLEYNFHLGGRADLRPYGRVDYADVDEDDPVFAGLESRTRISLGARYDITPSTAFKFELRRDRFLDSGESANSVQAQLAMIFW